MVGVELKYCEHCGGLWVRERGAGVVYCDRCRDKVDDLPALKKRPGRITLPGGPPASLAERYGAERHGTESRRREVSQSAVDSDSDDLQAMGGVA
jgi:hypothetical protein